MRIKKKQFLQAFLALTLVLALVRCVYPDIAANKPITPKTQPKPPVMSQDRDTSSNDMSLCYDSAMALPLPEPSCFYKPDGSLAKDRIYSVPNFGNAFPDLNDGE